MDRTFHRPRPRPSLARAPALLAAAVLGVAAAPATPGGSLPDAELPPEGRCPVISGAVAPGSEDASAIRLREGMVLGMDDLFALRTLLPEEVWQHREVFFYEGMRLEIGPCHRRYPVPEHWKRATERFADRVELDEEGNLRGFVAGWPFPPEAIDESSDPLAGLKWAWNLELRYRGAGPVGTFRLTDMPSRLGSVETYEGEFFLVRTRGRSDLPETQYVVPDAEQNLWVAGGRFLEPTNARHLAWRQFRPEKVLTRYKEADDTFVYVPTMRKTRRAASTWVDGVFTPRYTVSGDAGGGPVPFGASQFGVQGSIQPTAGQSAAASEHIRKGFTGLALRPNAWRFRYAGAREVLAPLNGERPGWPLNPDRNFGPSGLSVATDRWDVRYAVVIEGVARRRLDDAARLKLYVDYQTGQPLYYITRRSNGLLLEVGILVHRFSDDTHDYPPLPGGGRASVFDPVAAVFHSTAEGGTGWRRESYDVRSVGVDPDTLREMTSVSTLTRRGR